jgi:heptosyltransferase-3
VSTQNLNKRNSIKREFLTTLLDRVDEILATISTETPSLYPLFRWYQAEKTRIQPGTYEQMTQDHILIHQLYQTLLKKYLLEEDVKKAELHGSL